MRLHRVILTIMISIGHRARGFCLSAAISIHLRTAKMVMSGSVVYIEKVCNWLSSTYIRALWLCHAGPQCFQLPASALGDPISCTGWSYIAITFTCCLCTAPGIFVSFLVLSIPPLPSLLFFIVGLFGKLDCLSPDWRDCCFAGNNLYSPLLCVFLRTKWFLSRQSYWQLPCRAVIRHPFYCHHRYVKHNSASIFPSVINLSGRLKLWKAFWIGSKGIITFGNYSKILRQIKTMWRFRC